MATPEEDIAALIKPVTYFTQKAKYVLKPTRWRLSVFRGWLNASNRNIKKVAEILHTRHQDDIPATFKGLNILIVLCPHQIV
jgi:endonuclease III